MPDFAVGRALALALACAAFGADAQTMYKWVDDKGTTHFSESPPPDEKTEKKATKVTPKVIPSGNPSAYDPKAWKSKDLEARQRNIDKGAQAATDAQKRDRQQANCDDVRSRIAFLQNSPRIYHDNPDGTRSWMTDAERAAEIARAKEHAEASCR